jgi:hypothetical protein
VAIQQVADQAIRISGAGANAYEATVKETVALPRFRSDS